MYPDDFYGNSNNKSNTKQLPSGIDTLDDAIAYLQMARQTMGGNTKFRMVENGYSTDPDEYTQVNDVVLTGNKSLMAKSRHSDNQDYVLFVS
jgi:hypothetical protein